MSGTKKNPTVTHTHEHNVSYKTALVTLANAKSVLLKGQGGRYNNEPSGTGSSSPPETQTLHHLQPGVYKGEERDYLDLTLALAMQMSEIYHVAEPKSKKKESKKQKDRRVGDVKRAPWWGGCKTRYERMEHKPESV